MKYQWVEDYTKEHVDSIREASINCELARNIVVINSDSVSVELLVGVNILVKTHATFKVINFEGETVKLIQRDLPFGTSQIAINVTDLANGMYMLKVIDDKELNYAQTFQKK